MTRKNQVRGNAHYKSKLTEISVRRLKFYLSKSNSYKSMLIYADIFGVSYNCVYDIDRGRTWMHVI